MASRWASRRFWVRSPGGRHFSHPTLTLRVPRAPARLVQGARPLARRMRVPRGQRVHDRPHSGQGRAPRGRGPPLGTHAPSASARGCAVGGALRASTHTEGCCLSMRAKNTGSAHRPSSHSASVRTCTCAAYASRKQGARDTAHHTASRRSATHVTAWQRYTIYFLAREGARFKYKPPLRPPSSSSLFLFTHEKLVG